MFPLHADYPYIMDTGERTTLRDAFKDVGVVPDIDPHTTVSGYVDGIMEEKTYNGNNKLYISLYVDDCQTDLPDVWAIFKAHNIPLNVSVPTNTLDNITSNGKTVRKVLHEMEDAGCEIHSHSIDFNVLSAQSTRADALKMLKESKEILEKEGYKVNGFVNPGGTGAISWTSSGFSDLIFQYYKYCDCNVYPAGLSRTRTSLAGVTINNINSQLNASLRTYPLRKFFFHGLNDVTAEFLESLITKAAAKNIVFVTEHQIYDMCAYSIFQDRLLKLESIFEKYTKLDYDMFKKGYGRPAIESPATYKYMVRNDAGGCPRLITVDAEVITVKDSSNNYHLKKSDGSSFHVKVYTRDNGLWSRTTNETTTNYNTLDGNIIATNFNLLDDEGNTVKAVEYYYTY